MKTFLNWLRLLARQPAMPSDPTARLSTRDWADLPAYHPGETSRGDCTA